MRDKKGRFIKGHTSIGGFKEGHKIRLGVKHSDISKNKISISMKGKVPWIKGKKMPLSAKLAIGRALKGKPNYKIRGSKHYNWKDGRTELVKILRHSVEYRNWREKIFKKDNYTCQDCKKRGGDLEAHHYPIGLSELLTKYKIKTIEEALKCKEIFKAEAITLCCKCHQKTFLFYGNQYKKGIKDE